LLLLPRVALRETIPFLVSFALSPYQIFSGEESSPTLKLSVVIQVLLVLASKHGWLVLFPLVLIGGELQLHLLGNKVGLVHLPIIVLPMVGVQWILHG
jgi:hypothetical protein